MFRFGEREVMRLSEELEGPEHFYLDGWRCWSVEHSMHESADLQEASSTRGLPAIKATPRMWEQLHQRFLQDGGYVSFVEEFHRRQGGGAHRSDAGTSWSREDAVARPEAVLPSPSTATTDTPPPRGEEASTRGGQLFGHLAKGGGDQHIPVPMPISMPTPTPPSTSASRRGSTSSIWKVGSVSSDMHWSEVNDALDPFSSRDTWSLRRTMSTGLIDEAAIGRSWVLDALFPRSPDTNQANLSEEGRRAEYEEEFRRSFTRARNHRRPNQPDDMTSAFLGDELSVYRQNFFEGFFRRQNYAQGGSVQASATVAFAEGPRRLGLEDGGALESKQGDIAVVGLPALVMEGGAGAAGPAGSRGGAGATAGRGLGGRRRVSSLPSLVEMDEAPDPGQPVMLPLLDWENWTADRQHWAYPAVVRRFPRCLFENDSTLQLPPEPTFQDPSRGGGGKWKWDPFRAWDKSELVESFSTSFQACEEAPAYASEGLPSPRGAFPQEGERSPEAGSSARNQGVTSLLFPSPFEPYLLGEVRMRAAVNPELAAEGILAGPWRRRWLVLRQTFLFEFLDPPPMSSSPSSHDGGAASANAGVPQGRERRRGCGRVFPTPIGFLCLSQATVEEVASLWGPGTLLLRCEGRPGLKLEAGMGPPQGISERVETSVELQLSSENTRVYWRDLFRVRAALKVPSLFDAGPEVNDLEPGYSEDDEYNFIDEWEGEEDDELATGGVTPYNFPLLGRGRFSTVVTARRRDGRGGVRALKVGADRGGSLGGWRPGPKAFPSYQIMDKRTFWNRVHEGTERIDAIAREVFCHLFLTMEGLDTAATSAPGAIGDAVGVGGGRAGGDPRPDSRGAELHLHGRASEIRGSTDGHGDGTSREGEFRDEGLRPSEGGGADEGAEMSREQAREGGFGRRARAGEPRHHIVRLYSVMETVDEMVLEMECMTTESLIELSGDREDLIPLPEAQAACLMQNLLLAIDECLRLGICHRDVKPANLLYPRTTPSSAPEGVVLADMGMAARAGSDGRVKGRCGTAGFVAPEILRARSDEPYGINVDIFSAGVVLYLCLSGIEPFYGKNEQELRAANRRAEFHFSLPAWESISDSAKDLISRMMEPDPSRRITPREALRHPWIRRHTGDT